MAKAFQSLKWLDISLFSRYLGGNLLFQLGMILSEFVVLKLITPQEVGFIQLALLIQGYLIISRLGILNAYNLEYPGAIARKNWSRANEITETMNAHLLFSIALQALGFSVAVFYFFYTDRKELAYIMLAMVVYTAIEAIANYWEARNRSELNFRQIGKVRSFAVIMVLLSLFLPYWWGVQGAVLRLVLIQLTLVILYRIITKSQSSRINFIKGIWLDLFSVGWKLWLWSYLKSIGKSFPRLFVATFMGLTLLGQYAPVQWVLTSFVLFTSSLSSYLYPKLTHFVAHNHAKVSYTALKIVFLTIIALIPFALIAHFTLPFVFREWFPEYQSAAPALKLVVWASLLEVVSVGSSSWVSQKKWKFMFIYVGLALFFRGAGMLIPYYAKIRCLETVAVGILFSSIAIALTIVILVYFEHLHLTKETRKDVA